jgi:hypothetical protein
MTKPVRTHLAVAFALAALAAFAGCGEDSGSVDCPKPSLYDVRDGGLDPELQQALVERGCITATTPPDAGAD